MKKVVWAITALIISLSGILLGGLPKNESRAVEYVQLKKKTKHNYRAYTAINVSGNGSNADATLYSSYVGYHYRKIPVSGLKMTDAFPYYLMAKAGAIQDIGEESWITADNYFMSSGNLWVYYGDSLISDGFYADYAPGDYRYFSFYGGTQAKKRKKAAYKSYSVTVGGTESNADATAIPYSDIPTLTYYYRKVPLTNFNMANLVDFRLFRKEAADADFSEDRYSPVNYDYFFTNGYLYIPYGAKYSTPGASFWDFYNNYDYQVFVYSNEKKKKKKLTKQYVKKYQFSISSGASYADRTGTYTDGAYVQNTYYKRLAIPGLKKNDYKNIRVMRKNTDPATFEADTWEPGTFQVTDGNIWIDYGYDITDTGFPTTYSDSASGDYRVYVYK